ncbi:hypothetical protein [Edaphobacter sp. 12200R-103]|uniref:hypothetical protein n=1 Tax=Edaphobacter sp. 12200R-103 TaxID=2703788 RepID=UPI00138CED88|nr:hypothetical protein [Edaphobacter sp. 12200R-103]QHS51052.1 hypothetical protein GWR55_04325 [Edaphobacter sp. 12200R-103]
MATHTHSWVFFAGLFLLSAPFVSSQVFVVGEKTATSEIATSFTPTSLPLPTDKLGERGRRELIRNLEAEQGFAHLALPVGVITLKANGDLSPAGDKYRQMIYQKGEAAGPGDRVMVTALSIKGDQLVIDLNGGPYAKHRFLSHIQFNDNPVAATTGERPMGSRITLVFPGGIPDVSAPEVKALLAPVIDFGVKSGAQAYADTLPPRLRDAVAAHEVLVGMNQRMVIASLGAPERKVREESGDANGAVYEEWIYGHVPQTVKFIRFKGDRVSVVEIAELGKPLQIHDKNELEDAEVPANTRVIAMGDKAPGKDGGDSAAPTPPTLRLPGEAAPANAQGKVQYPTDKDASRQANRQPIPAVPGSPADPQSQAPPPSVQTTQPVRPQDIGRQAPSLGTQP